MRWWRKTKTIEKNKSGEGGEGREVERRGKEDCLRDWRKWLEEERNEVVSFRYSFEM